MVKTVDAMPNQVPTGLPTIKNLEDYGGNQVFVAAQNGQSVEYVGYAHLIPGSVTVKVGQNVHVGQLLGQLAIPETPPVPTYTSRFQTRRR